MHRAGDRIGEYQLLSPLGHGGFATVWSARSPHQRAPVAVKVLHPNMCGRGRESGPGVIDRFFAEARALHRLQHPGLVRIHEIIDQRQRGIAAYVMEQLTGVELSQVFEELDLAALVDVFARVTDILGYVHDHGIVHRDVKPANVMICLRDDPRLPPTVKLIDFGNAKHHSAQAGLKATEFGDLAGTLSAMAPELFERTATNEVLVTGAVDQWAVGVSLYWGLSGRPPFDGAPANIIRQILRDEPAPLRLHERYGDVDLPPALVGVVSRCLEKNPRRRYPTAARLTTALRNIAQQLQGPKSRGLLDHVDSLRRGASIVAAATSPLIPVYRTTEGTLPLRNATPSLPPEQETMMGNMVGLSSELTDEDFDDEAETLPFNMTALDDETL